MEQRTVWKEVSGVGKDPQPPIQIESNELPDNDQPKYIQRDGKDFRISAMPDGGYLVEIHTCVGGQSRPYGARHIWVEQLGWRAYSNIEIVQDKKHLDELMSDKKLLHHPKPRNDLKG